MGGSYPRSTSAEAADFVAMRCVDLACLLPSPPPRNGAAFRWRRKKMGLFAKLCNLVTRVRHSEGLVSGIDYWSNDLRARFRADLSRSDPWLEDCVRRGPLQPRIRLGRPCSAFLTSLYPPRASSCSLLSPSLWWCASSVPCRCGFGAIHSNRHYTRSGRTLRFKLRLWW